MKINRIFAELVEQKGIKQWLFALLFKRGFVLILTDY